MEEIVKKLLSKKQKISLMESCTGGAVSNAITNIPSSSEVFNYSAVTYSNDFKIKMGVNKEIIDKFTVYSKETANEMSKAICKFTNSDYGIGITGKINRQDPYNPYGLDNQVYISIYESKNKKYYNQTITCNKNTREENKDLIIENIITLLKNIL